MIYEFFYKAKAEPDRNYEITYCVAREEEIFYLEAFINGSRIKETSCLGNCGEEKAKNIAELLAEKSVHPLHIDNIISDLHF